MRTVTFIIREILKNVSDLLYLYVFVNHTILNNIGLKNKIVSIEITKQR